ncbi:MAG TPA: uracil-DNA glycosylase [Candidatus Dormibacteraeota bacterium]|nr:uracil-DNA glycosylase [Candidatus Dormibacteraeota bacterium]
MADRNKATAIEALLSDLPTVTIGATFNQFREASDQDLPGAPAIRLANLRRYLDERHEADVIAVGEAAGYQGMRWSGIAFTSEFDLSRWGDPYRRSCRRPRPWKEPSGTIVHGVLDEFGSERRVILWNTVPTHPHLPGKPLSNRRPTREEVAAGRVFVERLVDIVRPRVLIGVGRIASAALPAALYVRHPAQSGATAFRSGIREILGRSPGGPFRERLEEPGTR